MDFEDQRKIIEGYFGTLEDWKRLPAYKLETRIDSIVGFALPEIIKDNRGYSVKTIIPELPLRIGTLLDNDKEELDESKKKKIANRSYKVDFYVLTECHKNLLVEFKSDSNSRNGKQDKYLKKAKKCGMEEILDGIIKLKSASPAKYEDKYNHLLEKLEHCGLVTRENGIFEPTTHQLKVDIIYIQPHELEGDDPINTIYYETLADSISRCYKGSVLMERFARSIREWSND